MKLKLKRDQQSKGMIGKKVVFILDATIVLTEEEGALADKYGMRKNQIYFDEEKNIRYTITDLSKGASFECKDILEAVEIEDKISEACKNYKVFLDHSAKFGGEEVIEF